MAQTQEAQRLPIAEVVRSMAVAAVKKWGLSILAWPLVILLLLLLLTVGALAMGTAESSGGVSVAESASTYALQLIPPNMLAIYQSSEVHNECPGLSWTVIAALTHLESDDDRNVGPSSAGAMGANQFLPTTWDGQGLPVVPVSKPFGVVANGEGVDGDGDGIADIMNPMDSVPAAAHYLCQNGGGNVNTLPNALFAYNHAWWYVNGGIDDHGQNFIGVLPLAQQLAVSVAAVSKAATVSLQAAESQLGVTYVYGGETPGQAFDCSGLVQWADQQAGLSLPRTSQDQWAATKKDEVPESQAQAGDLVFFVGGGDGGTVTNPGHVGIIVDPATGTMIDAPHTGATVRYESYLTFGGFVGITDPFEGQAPS